MTLSLKKQLPVHLSGYFQLGAIWLFSGFALGTAMLLIPLRIWVNYVRANDISSTAENIVVVMMIISLVLISFNLSLKLFQWQRLSDYIWAGRMSLLLPALAGTMALWLFMHPEIINGNETSETVSSKFTVGPYPTEEKMRQLKKEGYTTIVSLLHPAVVPFEPSLIKDEEAAAATLHMQIIKAPMLPWIGDNEASLKIIEDVVKNGKGKYYFHCYLGKDRVNVVKNLIIKLSGSTVQAEEPQSQRSFEAQGSFERGDIYKIDSAVYLTPFPTDEEMLAFFLAGNIRSVVNIMDSTEEIAGTWIQKEQKALESMRINFKVVSVTTSATDKETARVLKVIDSLPKPLVVHHWNTTCPQSIQFRKSYYDNTKFIQLNLATKDAATY